jgi:hypothetical protein
LTAHILQASAVPAVGAASFWNGAPMLLEILAVIGLFAIVYILTQWLLGMIN